jgi:hypothetical protein
MGTCLSTKERVPNGDNRKGPYKKQERKKESGQETNGYDNLGGTEMDLIGKGGYD